MIRSESIGWKDQGAKWWQLVYCVREWQKTQVRHFEDSLKAAFEQAKQAEDLRGSCNHFFQRGQQNKWRDNVLVDGHGQ